MKVEWGVSSGLLYVACIIQATYSISPESFPVFYCMSPLLIELTTAKKRRKCPQSSSSSSLSRWIQQQADTPQYDSTVHLPVIPVPSTGHNWIILSSYLRDTDLLANMSIGSRRISRRFYRLENFDLNLTDGGLRASDENRFVFEVSWETCNKGSQPFVMLSP